MPIFDIQGTKLKAVEQQNFSREKDLQKLIENNLIDVFNCRFVASEFSTGAIHAGRIDSLALSEEDNPVIIEYKKKESSDLINQSLFYLHWISDHKGDFEIAVQKSLGSEVSVDWSDIRVICIAPNYKKYDIHAVQVMGANIELWKYRLYKNSVLHLEEVFYGESTAGSSKALLLESNSVKNPVMVAAGKKAAQARIAATYDFNSHISGKSDEIVELAHLIREFIGGLDPSFDEVPKKYYVAYKIAHNIVCMEIMNRHIKLFLKLPPSEVSPEHPGFRDVTAIGHYGTGDTEFVVTNQLEFDAVKPYIQAAYNKLGG